MATETEELVTLQVVVAVHHAVGVKVIDVSLMELQDSPEQHSCLVSIDQACFYKCALVNGYVTRSRRHDMNYQGLLRCGLDPSRLMSASCCLSQNLVK